MASEIVIDDEYSVGKQPYGDEVEEGAQHPGVQKVCDILLNNPVNESPIDINIAQTTKLEIPPLVWHHLDLPPKKVKFNNTGHTVILSAKWQQERPYISGGPFIGNYVFSQLHFHWGANNMEGSEHTITGVPLPLEMHAVFFKSCYLTQESALKKKDGMAVVAFLFNLQDEPNPAITILTDAMYSVHDPQTSFRLKSYPLSTYLKPFTDDYYLYVGSVNTASCVHCILWLISREPVGISIDQIDSFRTLLDSNLQPLLRNFRMVQPLNERVVFHVNPSGNLHSTLMILQKKFDKKTSQRPQQVNKYPRSSKEYVGATVYRAEVETDPFKQYKKEEEKAKYNLRTKVNVDPKILERIFMAKNK